MIEKYGELIKLFSENGYTITHSDENTLGAENKNGITFTQMKEGEYFEAGIYIASDEAVVNYEILTGEYSIDIFGDKSKNKTITEEWKDKLAEGSKTCWS